MTYKCIRAFPTSKGLQYHYGNMISANEYQKLTSFEKRNFNETKEEKKQHYRANDGCSEPIRPPLPDYAAPTSYDNSNNDFGGGSGGDGATSDY